MEEKSLEELRLENERITLELKQKELELKEREISVIENKEQRKTKIADGISDFKNVLSQVFKYVCAAGLSYTLGAFAAMFFIEELHSGDVPAWIVLGTVFFITLKPSYRIVNKILRLCADKISNSE